MLPEIDTRAPDIIPIQENQQVDEYILGDIQDHSDEAVHDEILHEHTEPLGDPGDKIYVPPIGTDLSRNDAVRRST